MARRVAVGSLVQSLASLLISTNNALAPGVDGGLGPIGQMQLAEDVGDVALDGLLAQVEALRDLRVAQPLGYELEHLHLPVGELVEDVRRVTPGTVQFPHDPGRQPGASRGSGR